jgi:hypothetical protein
MDSLLRYAYVEEPCNSCGGHFTTTLLDALTEHRLHKEWNPPRPCSVCAGENSAFSARLSRELLEQLDSAWQAVRDEAKAASYDLRLGVHPEAREESRRI